jgi:hypothetical protein
MMSNKASLRWQWWAASCGILFAVLYGVFWGIFGHNIPPAAPDLSPADLAAFYIQNHTSILFGETMAAFVGVLYAPWTAQMTITLWRIEGASPVLAICVLIGGALTTWVVMFCPALWAAGAYRMNIDPNILRTLNDVAFIVFNITYMNTTLQAVLMGVAGLIDKSEYKVFPAWVCWWGILTGVSFLPITALPFYTSGPVAWNGLITFWIGFTTFFVWLITAGWYMAVEATRRSRLAAGYVSPATAVLRGVA